ncbi:MAG: heat-inducible transcription repressor HrcA [Deltaproteobacteria bacterium]|nr:MAG: heat-inducible transcription repressor HrcA [Deltaproteobacteria bacterium]
MEQLSKREQEILRLVVNEYIQTAEAVGSRTLSKKTGIGLSPATIRNIMRDLEELGYLRQPHISAGRVPTERGFRYYVDSIINVRGISPEEKQMIEQYLKEGNREVPKLLQEVSRALSDLSHYAGLVMAPKLETIRLKHIDFVKLRDDQILVILISYTGIVQNWLIEDEFNLSNSDLTRMSNYLNSIIEGHTLYETREEILTQMEREKARYDEMMKHALALGKAVIDTTFEKSVDRDVIIEGKTNIFEEPEFEDIERMKAIFKAFEEKSKLVKLLDKSLTASGVQIYIGSESQMEDFQDLSLITATYTNGSSVLGTLGVLGPTRMNYTKVIPVVDYTAELVSEILRRM